MTIDSDITSLSNAKIQACEVVKGKFHFQTESSDHYWSYPTIERAVRFLENHSGQRAGTYNSEILRKALRDPRLS